MEIPDFINEYIKRGGYRFCEVVHQSKWKHTLVVKLEKEGKLYILKAIHPSTPQEIKSKFRLESEFYLKNTSESVPALIESTDALLVIRFIEGSTLRDLINSDIENLNQITKPLLRSLNGLYDANHSVISGKADFSNAYDNISSLAQSGPIQSKPLSFPEKWVNKALAQLFKLKLKIKLNRINTSTLKLGFAHGDLHYNNVYVAPANTVYFIDFENVNYRACFDFDILYLLVMIQIKLDKRDISDKLKEQFFGELKLNRTLYEVYNLYMMAISINRRFTGKPLRSGHKIRTLISLLS